MSMYNWLEQETIQKGYTTKKHYWHSLVSAKELKDLRENWPAIYNSTYHRELKTKNVLMWIGEYKDHLQQNWIIDDGGLTFEEN
jgi:hypothetical protein